MAKQEKHIELVRNYPILYDLSNEDYKNIRKKDKVWTAIGNELGESGDDAKSKWKNMRDSYAKYIRSCKTKTGQAASQVKRWLRADEMESFRPFLSFAKTVSNVSDIDITQDFTEGSSEGNSTGCTQSFVQSPIDINNVPAEPNVPTDSEAHQQVIENIHPLPPTTSLTPSTSAKTFKSAHELTTPIKSKICRKRNSEPNSSVSEMIAYFEKKKKADFDAVDCLFLAYAKTVKNFSGERQVLAKMKIAEVLMEQELLDLQEKSSINTTLWDQANRPASASSYETLSSNNNLTALSPQSSVDYGASQNHCANQQQQSTTVRSVESNDAAVSTQEITMSNYITQFDPYNK